MKPKTRIFGTLATIALCAFVYVHAETRYVSHSGSNTFPYTTWETAANTVEAANLATLPGDTMFIDTGSFYLSAPVYTQPKITMRGRGMDSTHILGSNSVWAMFLPEDSTYVYDIHFDGRWNASQETGTGYAFVKFSTDSWRTFSCNRCKFSRFGSSPIGFDKMIYVEVRNCWFETWESYALSLRERGDYVIENNTFDVANELGEFFDFFAHIGAEIIRRNIFLGGGQFGINGGSTGSLELTNNLFYESPYLWYGVTTGADDILVANNTFYIVHRIAASGIILDVFPYGLQRCLIYNNIFVDNPPVVHFRESVPPDADVRILHNGFFALKPYPEYAMVTLDYHDTLHLDSAYANIRSDPMLVDPINGDLRLQRGSPCIDAGVPWLLDVDGTRSDMGAFGGPGGQVYAYVDYPPKSPQEFTGTRQESQVILSWYRNRESDLHHYILFRSEQSPVQLDPGNVVAYVSRNGKTIGEVETPTKHLLLVDSTDTTTTKQLDDGEPIPLATPRNLASVFYSDKTAQLDHEYYYVLVAVDTSSLVSPASDEVHLPAATGLSGVDSSQPDPPAIEQNYPNPFNAVTAIVYNLPNLGAQPAPVELIIYNMLGQVVKQLIDERQYPGKHIVYWDGTDSQGHAVSSGVYLYQLKASGIDFIENRKMIVMK